MVSSNPCSSSVNAYRFVQQIVLRSEPKRRSADVVLISLITRFLTKSIFTTLYGRDGRRSVTNS